MRLNEFGSSIFEIQFNSFDNSKRLAETVLLYNVI
jgi:hypothetical protein